VPVDGSVAVSVVVDALRQNGQSFSGPQLIVPYTVLRSDADRNRAIGLLEDVEHALTDTPFQNYTYNWKGSTC
jgi:hypothetical protein